MIGLLVRETIQLRRVYDCEHAWEPAATADEERCQKCQVIVTPDGKARLAEMASAFHRRQQAR